MSLVIPSWPLPPAIRLGWTDRLGGYSESPFGSFNLAHHVDDSAEAVIANRAALLTLMRGCISVRWLSQVHGTDVVTAEEAIDGVEADAAWTRASGVAACVMTADCLPVFFWQEGAPQVAVAHAGWRGLSAGVLSETLAKFSRIDRVRCGLGPAIGPESFEVGEDVVSAFKDWPQSARLFRPLDTEGKWLADLPGLAEAQLRSLGVETIYKTAHCTFSRPEQYYSYRRDGQTGRMANVIWIV